jgi:hypothetical protein
MVKCHNSYTLFTILNFSETQILQVSVLLFYVTALFLVVTNVGIYTIYNGPTNALVWNKTLIQMSHTKKFKFTPSCFDDHLMIETCWSDFKCFSV